MKSDVFKSETEAKTYWDEFHRRVSNPEWLVRLSQTSPNGPWHAQLLIDYRVGGKSKAYVTKRNWGQGSVPLPRVTRRNREQALKAIQKRAERWMRKNGGSPWIFT